MEERINSIKEQIAELEKEEIPNTSAINKLRWQLGNLEQQKAEAEGKTETEPETGAEAEGEPETEPETGAEAEGEPETEPETGDGTEDKPEE